MSFKFPFTNYHELNLTWVLDQLKKLFEESAENVSVIETYNGRLTAVETELPLVEETAQGAAQQAAAAGTLAQSAKATADTAQENAIQAQGLAGTARQEAQQAQAAADAATQAAQQAQATAQNFDGRITQAENNASEALEASRSFENRVQSAITTANNAAQTATNAQGIATRADQNAALALDTLNAQRSELERIGAEQAALITGETESGKAEIKALLDTIPADYTELSQQVSEITELSQQVSEITETSKNILPVESLGPVEVYGVTVEIKNGIICAHGKATFSGGRTIRLTPSFDLEPGVYTFSTDGSVIALFVQTGSNILGRVDYSKTNTFVVDSTITVYLGLNVVLDQIYNVDQKIQLEKGNIATLPLAPAQISAIDLYARNQFIENSKNILSSEYKVTTVNGVNVVYNDGLLTLSGTATASGGRLTPIITPFILKAGTYTLSVAFGATQVFIETGSTILAKAIYNAPSTFTLKNDVSVYVGINVNVGSYNVSFGIQLEKGSTATTIRKPSWKSLIDYVAREEIAKLQALILENI